MDQGEAVPVVLDERQLSDLSEKTVFFGHHSVGANILDGLESISETEDSLSLKIDIFKNDPGFENANFIHTSVGSNYDPVSKIDDFREDLRQFKTAPDFAFFKFCYVDFNPTTDIQSLFSHYETVMDELEEEFPETVFVHSTVPLVARKVSLRIHIKNLIKMVIGRPVNRYKDNIVRETFSNKVRSRYGESNPTFDIAEWESLHQDGQAESYIIDGVSIPALCREYASDEGHLNDLGSRILADQLLKLLAEN